MIVQGSSTKGAHFSRNLRVNTIEAHRAKIMDKLDIHELVRHAIAGWHLDVVGHFQRFFGAQLARAMCIGFAGGLP